MSHEATTHQAVLGQKYAYATAALLVGAASYVSLLGLEKAALAVFFGWMALRTSPPPALSERRTWARAGIGLGAVFLVVAPTLLALYWDRIRDLIAALERLQ